MPPAFDKIEFSRCAFMSVLCSVMVLAGSLWAEGFTEFYVQPGGSNLNAGSGPTGEARLLYSSGSWNAGAGVFTVAAGNPQADGVVAGDFVSVSLVGASKTGFVSRVVGCTDAVIQVSPTAVMGTPPADGTGTLSLRVGGAWAGPGGTVGFPFGFAAKAGVNEAGDPVRINFKGGAPYAVTAGMTHSLAGPVFWEGYGEVPGDKAMRAVIDGGATGTAYRVLHVSGSNNYFCGFEFAHNGNSGSTSIPMVETAVTTLWRQCVFRSAYGMGIANTGSTTLHECEASGNWVSRGSSSVSGGMGVYFSGTLALRCMSRDNWRDGYSTDGGVLLHRCIADSNGGSGAGSTGNVNLYVVHSDFFNNAVDGYSLAKGSATNMHVLISSCNFVANGNYGWKTGVQPTNGLFIHNGYGAGTAANTAGEVQVSRRFQRFGDVTYPDDMVPYEDPEIDDFRIVLDEARGAGFGGFLQIAPGYSGTLAAPAIGAAQR